MQGSELLLERVWVLVAHVLQVNEVRACTLNPLEQLVQFELDRLGVSVLRVLDDEDHQEGDQRRAGVRNQLPGIGEVEERAGGCPHDDASKVTQAGRTPYVRICGRHHSRGAFLSRP